MDNESKAIILEIMAFADTWNRGDTKDAASFFIEEGMTVF